MGDVSRQAQIVLLCEDGQQKVFVWRFLKAAGRLSTPKAKRRFRVEIAPPGKCSAER